MLTYFKLHTHVKHHRLALKYLQSILNIVDFGMSPVEAVTVPRIHCEGAGLHLEARVQ